jgi:ATP-dependent DNA ligase
MLNQPLVPPKLDATIPQNLESGNYIAEEKIDGSRYLLYLGFNPYIGADSVDTALLSRKESSITNRYINKTAQVPHLIAPYLSLRGTVLDGECFLIDCKTTSGVMASSPAKALAKQQNLGQMAYYAFDIMFYKGEDVRQLPFARRREILELVVNQMANPYVRTLPQRTKNLQAFFEEVVARGGEGVVIKDLRSAYGAGCSKLKKSYDVSGIVTGYTKGKGSFAHTIGSISVSVYKDGKLVEVANVQGFPLEVREAIGENFEQYRGRVVDVYAMEVLPPSVKSPCGRLRHAVFHRFREDITPETLTVEKLYADLNQAKASVSVLRTNRSARHQFTYKQSTTGKRGSKEGWAKAAQAVMARFQGIDDHLKALELTAIPTDLKMLTTARNNAIRKAHPDVGGSDEMAAQVNKAYTELKKLL